MHIKQVCVLMYEGRHGWEERGQICAHAKHVCCQRAHTSAHSLEVQTEKLACLSQCCDLRENHPKYSFPFPL
jgi:hypothetical protein